MSSAARNSCSVMDMMVSSVMVTGTTPVTLPVTLVRVNPDVPGRIPALAGMVVPPAQGTYLCPGMYPNDPPVLEVRIPRRILPRALACPNLSRLLHS